VAFFQPLQINGQQMFASIYNLTSNTYTPFNFAQVLLVATNVS
jgi:hypothetical protein